jgi:hypothetical protein
MHAMGVDPIVEQLLEIVTRTGLSYTETAIACAASPSTLRQVLQSRCMPGTDTACSKIAKFVERNRGAMSRDEIRFVP